VLIVAVLVPDQTAVMKLSSVLQVAALAATATAKSCLSRRPTISPSPYQPRLPIPNPPKRHKVCVVETNGDGVTDDSEHILTAFHECNDGGHVLFSKDETYTIGTAMDWTFLKHIDIDIQGRILFSNNTDYWQANSFRFVFQNVTTFFKLGGDDVWIYGGKFPYLCLVSRIFVYRE
jgi:galacturan 1,4-alpha-galacturonidase